MNQVVKGAIAENYVAYELSKRGHNSFRIGATGEIDVLTTGGMRVEVKSSSGTKGTADGVRHFSFSFNKNQVREVEWFGEKSDYCICVGFNDNYTKPLFALCVPTRMVRQLSASSGERKSEGYHSLGVRYLNGLVESSNNMDYSPYINNWEIIK